MAPRLSTVLFGAAAATAAGGLVFVQPSAPSGPLPVMPQSYGGVLAQATSHLEMPAATSEGGMDAGRSILLGAVLGFAVAVAGVVGVPGAASAFSTPPGLGGNTVNDALPALAPMPKGCTPSVETNGTEECKAFYNWVQDRENARAALVSPDPRWTKNLAGHKDEIKPAVDLAYPYSKTALLTSPIVFPNKTGTPGPTMAAVGQKLKAEWEVKSQHYYKSDNGRMYEKGLFSGGK